MEQVEAVPPQKKQIRAKSSGDDELMLKGKQAVRRELEGQEQVTIVLDQRRDSSEPGQVYAAINGYGFLMQRGMPITVPKALCNVLDESMQVKYLTEWDSEGKPKITPHESLSYPYRVVSAAPKSQN